MVRIFVFILLSTIAGLEGVSSVSVGLTVRGKAIPLSFTIQENLQDDGFCSFSITKQAAFFLDSERKIIVIP